MSEQVQEIPNDEELLLVDCQYFDVESTAAAVKSVDEEEEDSIGRYTTQCCWYAFSLTSICNRYQNELC